MACVPEYILTSCGDNICPLESSASPNILNLDTANSSAKFPDKVLIHA